METYSPVPPFNGVQVANVGWSRVPLVHNVDYGRYLGSSAGMAVISISIQVIPLIVFFVAIPADWMYDLKKAASKLYQPDEIVSR